MASVWYTFMEEFPWVCKLPLIDCLEMFWYYIDMNQEHRHQDYKDWIIDYKFPAFEKSVKDKEDIFKNKV